jgi:arylsulfatase A-like enzyme
LVIVVDGLRATALGAYGNTTFPTPGFDQLAAESFLWDFAFADSADLLAIYRSFWHSQHPLRLASNTLLTPALPQRLSDHGYATTLITDDPDVGTLASDEGFNECVHVQNRALDRASNVENTGVARLFAACCNAIHPVAESKAAARKKPQLIWVHARGMHGAWDAPHDCLDALTDREEGDPAPYEDLAPPHFEVDLATDSDSLYAVNCAYAAEVMALDECIETVLQCVAALDHERWLTAIVGSRGFALGEHGHIGRDGRLFSECLQVPVLLRLPDERSALGRSKYQASHLDLVPTLLDWLGQSDAVGGVFDGRSLLPTMNQLDAPWRHELVATSGANEISIRTSDWYLRNVLAETTRDQSGFQLFVRPDDHWEANDVAALCPQVVEQLTNQLAETCSRLSSNPHS